MSESLDAVALSSVFALERDPEYGMVWVVSCPKGDAHLFQLDYHAEAVAFARRQWFPQPILDDMAPECECDGVSRRG